MAFLAFAGWLADRATSRRIPFLIGLLVQAASTALFLFSSKVGVLIAARALQGLSTAVVYSAGLAILVDTVGMANIGRNAGYFLSSANLGVLISPLIGGIVYHEFGYRTVVTMMVSLVGVDVYLRFIMIEKSAAAAWLVSEDGESQVCRPMLAHGSPSYGTTESHQQSVKSESKRNPSPFIQLLMTPKASADIYAVLVSYILISAFDAGLAVFVKERFRWPSSSAGTIFLAIALPSLLSPVGGALSGKYGPKWVIVIGFTISATALFVIGLVESPTLGQLVSLCALLVLIGNYPRLFLKNLR